MAYKAYMIYNMCQFYALAMQFIFHVIYLLKHFMESKWNVIDEVDEVQT